MPQESIPVRCVPPASVATIGVPLESVPSGGVPGISTPKRDMGPGIPTHPPDRQIPNLETLAEVFVENA